jgi:hypothetical protein
MVITMIKERSSRWKKNINVQKGLDDEVLQEGNHIDAGSICCSADAATAEVEVVLHSLIYKQKRPSPKIVLLAGLTTAIQWSLTNKAATLYELSQRSYKNETLSFAMSVCLHVKLEDRWTNFYKI